MLPQKVPICRNRNSSTVFFVFNFSIHIKKTMCISVLSYVRLKSHFRLIYEVWTQSNENFRTVRAVSGVSSWLFSLPLRYMSINRPLLRLIYILRANDKMSFIVFDDFFCFEMSKKRSFLKLCAENFMFRKWHRPKKHVYSITMEYFISNFHW